ncbi:MULTISPECIES: hypothetical protein [Kamptonema]|uniref:hypothetical protein n=1 Tax=Kamptonema TaxID=1501433 RepID=UPI0011D1F3AC|nr:MULTISPECIES: hypothetical protein [Kamptonema]
MYNPANLEINAAKTSEKSDMELMNDPQAKREADRAQAHRDELTELIAHAMWSGYEKLLGRLLVETVS